MLRYLFKPGPSEPTAEFSRRINIPSVGYGGESFSIFTAVPHQIFISMSAWSHYTCGGVTLPLTPQSMVHTIHPPNYMHLTVMLEYCMTSNGAISSDEDDDPPHDKR